MARKFGKKNIIKVDPLAYNLGLIGESGIGKTTIAKEICEKLVGENGYIIANIGKEDGVDAIPNAIYEDIPDWSTFDEFTRDIIENKNTDYKDLRVIVYDTLDELISITEPEVIRLHNRENPQKKVKTIKAAFGGYMAGEDKAMEIILDRVWELKKVGVSMFIVGHTKTRTMTDVITGLEYDKLTTNMSHRYFNAFKTKLHVLGVASIDRNIKSETIQGKVVGRITDEARVITFRDDNFNIDSKSRFSEITPSISFDADLFIEAINDAIKKEHEKQSNPKPIEEVKESQKAESEARVEEYIKNKSSVNVEKNEKLIEKIKANLTSIDANKIQEIMQKHNIKDFTNPAEIETKALEEIESLI